MLRYLGAKRVFFVGVDFRMAADYGYAFEQGIDHKRPKKQNVQPKWDNNQYSVVNNWLCKLQKDGVFRRFGIEFFNCFQKSSLRAFPYVPFEEAMRECKGEVEDVPSLSHWYEKL